MANVQEVGRNRQQRAHTSALVIPWVNGEADAWSLAAKPELLGPAVIPWRAVTWSRGAAAADDRHAAGMDHA
ncbi:Protein of unknown function [Mycobacterium canettii CIPT 140070017]|nr:Protein of unknown function [Mycobacterium canettii CIPT 140070017]